VKTFYWVIKDRFDFELHFSEAAAEKAISYFKTHFPKSEFFIRIEEI